MAKLIVVKCPYCGGSVDYNGGAKSGRCMNCGSSVIMDEESVSITNVTNIISGSISFIVIAYHRDKQFKLVVKNDLTIKGEYRKDAEYGAKNPLMITATSNNLPVDIKVQCRNIPLEKVQILFDNGTFRVMSECKKPLFVNGKETNSKDFTVGYGDLIRYGEIVLRPMPAAKTPSRATGAPNETTLRYEKKE